MSEIIWVDNDTGAPVGASPTPTGLNRPGALWATNHALWVTQPGSQVNPASAAAGYARSYPVTNDPRRLTGTGAINVAAGVINQAGGVANDTMLVYIHIAQNAAAVTLTVAGFLDETGAAVSLVFTGSTTGDTIFYPHLINSGGAMTLTASVASKVTVGVRAA